ncbi:MAG: Gfo/Idh/MocA family oxidoreductase, partial [Burkholderiales bacterium]|nr:Gfo/Idh/MocA family oxidoreductase [Phycisphaerae bacterium]
MTTPLRGVCIGAGYFSRFHLDAWRRLDDVEIVAVCDRDLSKATQAADEFGVVNVRDDAIAAIDEFHPDFVDIITPPDSHLALIRAAADRKIAIICQKPLAPDFASAGAIVDLVDRAGVPFMVHENFRF